MIFDFSDKINQHGLKVIFSNAEESNILTKKAIVSMSQIHSTNIELVNNKLNIFFGEKFNERRGRINCSMKDSEGWRWLGNQFSIN